MGTLFTVITEATSICNICNRQKTFRGVDAQIQATADGMMHSLNDHQND